jgi:hypothetical protein
MKLVISKGIYESSVGVERRVEVSNVDEIFLYEWMRV